MLVGFSVITDLVSWVRPKMQNLLDGLLKPNIVRNLLVNVDFGPIFFYFTYFEFC